MNELNEWVSGQSSENTLKKYTSCHISFASKELNLQAIYLQALNYISKIALLKGVQSCFSTTHNRSLLLN